MQRKMRWVPVGAKQWSVVDQFRAQLNGCSPPEESNTDLGAHAWVWVHSSGPASGFDTMTCERCGMQIEQVEDDTT